MRLRVGRRARNIDASGRDWAAEQGFTNQFVDGDHELANRRNTKRRPRGGQELLGQRHQRSGRALIRMIDSGFLVITAYERHIEYLRQYGTIMIVAGSEAVTWGGRMPLAGATQRLRFTAV